MDVHEQRRNLFHRLVKPFFNVFLCIADSRSPHVHVLNFLVSLHLLKTYLFAESLNPFFEGLQFVLIMLVVITAFQAEELIVAGETNVSGHCLNMVDTALR